MTVLEAQTGGPGVPGGGGPEGPGFGHEPVGGGEHQDPAGGRRVADVLRFIARNPFGLTSSNEVPEDSLSEHFGHSPGPEHRTVPEHADKWLGFPPRET